MRGHLAGPDVRRFDRLARLYEFVMPAADAATLQRGLACADREVERLLDVGGGTGRAARALDQRGDGVATSRALGGRIDATVVDAATGMVRRAAGSGVVGVAERLPVRDESVDAVTVVDALHHFADADAAIAEAARVLRPGGVLVVREFDPSTLRGRLLAGVEHAVGFDSRFYTAADLLDRVRAAGLASFRPEGGFAYTVVGVKRRD